MQGRLLRQITVSVREHSVNDAFVAKTAVFSSHPASPRDESLMKSSGLVIHDQPN